jgi:hypothetical protein
MVTVNRCLAALALALAVTAFASPSFAQRGDAHVSAARAAAIHECSVREQKYSEYTWGNREYFEYLACMTEHGQPE